MDISNVILSSNYGLPHPLNAQSIFNKCAMHLIHQGRRSVDSLGVGCAYRGDNGAACAVGALISEERYTPDMEGRLVDSLSLNFMPDLKPYLDLLDDLQGLHDHGSRPDEGRFASPTIDRERLTAGLRKIAASHDLSADVLDVPAVAAPAAEITSLLRPSLAKMEA